MAINISEKALISFHKIRCSVSEEQRDFRKLEMNCYICSDLGHIAIDCSQFKTVLKGNLKLYYKKIRRVKEEERMKREKSIYDKMKKGKIRKRSIYDESI